MPLAAFPKCYLDALVAKKTMSVEQWVNDAAEQLDVDGLEFYWGFTPQDSAGIERVRKLVESHDLCIPMMCYSPDFIKPDRNERLTEIEKQKRVIDTTA